MLVCAYFTALELQPTVSCVPGKHYQASWQNRIEQILHVPLGMGLDQKVFQMFQPAEKSQKQHPLWSKKIEVQALDLGALESMTLLAKDSPKDWCFDSTMKGYRGERAAQMTGPVHLEQQG